MKFRKGWLILCVCALDWLRGLGLIKNVWYKAELDLAKIRAKELMEAFGWGEEEDLVQMGETERRLKNNIKE